MKTAGKVFLGVSAIILTILLVLFSLMNHFFFNIDKLPEGEFISEAVSPTDLYTARSYLANGDATTPFMIRVELVKHGQSKSAKNIYWDKGEEADLIWKSPHILTINGRTLDVRKEVHDFRKDS